MEVNQRTKYQYSSAAPKDWTQELPDLRELNAPKEERRVKNRPEERLVEAPARVRSTGIVYALFLTGILVTMVVVLLQYMQLQSNVTRALSTISQKESYLSELRLENDERLNTIETSVDMEEVKRYAMQELGMRYATEEQVVTYTGELRNYVVQYETIP